MFGGMFGLMKMTENKGFMTISVVEAKEMIEKGSYDVILDVRNHDEFERGHIRGAKIIPVSEMSLKAGELDGLKNKKVLVICRGGVRSKDASRQLASLGFIAVYNVAGGMGAWENANYAVERGKR